MTMMMTIIIIIRFTLFTLYNNNTPLLCSVIKYFFYIPPVVVARPLNTIHTGTFFISDYVFFVAVRMITTQQRIILASSYLKSLIAVIIRFIMSPRNRGALQIYMVFALHTSAITVSLQI
jgi:hypothetical protein